MNSVAYDIMTLLGDNAKGTAGTDLFCYEWGVGTSGTNEVDAQTLITDQESIDAMIKDEYENPVFEIKVRGSKSESGNVVYNRARALYEWLIQLPRTTINTIDYIEFAPFAGGIRSLGRDKDNRFVVSMTFFTYRDSIGA